MSDSPPRQPATATPSIEDTLVASLPTASRLALAYAPRSARMPTLALFALDARLAGLLRHSREPMLAQLRLSWWRETLGLDAEKWPSGEPLLGALRNWNGHHTALTALVEGWEALTGPAPLDADALDTMAGGRAAAFAALARALGCESEQETARRIGRAWALSDLAMRLGNVQERETAGSLALAADISGFRVSRPLRPLLVLHGLAARRLAKGDEAAAGSPIALLKALRQGLFGF